MTDGNSQMVFGFIFCFVVVLPCLFSAVILDLIFNKGRLFMWKKKDDFENFILFAHKKEEKHGTPSGSD